MWRSLMPGGERRPGKGRLAASGSGTLLAALLLGVILAAAWPGGAGRARAQGFDLTVSPVKKEITAQPGERVEFTVTLINHTAEDLELLVYPMDFFIKPDGSYEFHEPDHYTYSCSRWIEIPRGRLSLSPRAQHEEPFALQVPPDAEPGGHFAVLFFQDASEPPPGTGVKPTYRIGSLILVTVPGDIVRQAEIRSLSVDSDLLSLWGPPEGGEGGWPARSMKYRLEVENTGNVHLTIQAALTYRAAVGLGSGSVDLGEFTILPGTVRRFEGYLPSPPMLGYFRAEATIRYGPDMYTFDTERRASSGFWAVPLLWILFLVLLAVGLRYLVRFLRGRFRVSLKVTRR